MAGERLNDQLRRQGLEHHRAERWDDAAARYNEALAADPADADCHFLLALVETARGRLGRAHECISAALAIAPSNTDFLFFLGEIDRQRGCLPTAIRAFESAIGLTSPTPRRLIQLADLYLANGQACVSESWAKEAVLLAPKDAESLHMLAEAVRAQGRSDESIPLYRAASGADADYSVRHQSLLMTMNYSDSMSANEVFHAHRSAGRLPNLDPDVVSWQESAPVSVTTPLRIGYVSADFGYHVVSFFFEPVVTGHLRNRTEVYCYFTGGTEDAQCARIRSSGVTWRNVSGLDVDGLVALMRADRLQVAVDLSGHTAGNRLEVFARRVASTQVSWLGYPNTTGVPAMDFRLTDTVCDPVGVADALHTETLWRLSRCFVVFQPRDDAPSPAPPPVTRNGYVTFGCFNRIEKLTLPALRLWGKVLSAVPGSRLLLKARNLGEANLDASIRARFAAAGGDAARIDLEPATVSYEDHLARYAAVDMALDSYPYCGTTTTCEALWMGVPVLTLAGTTHASRVGASLLAAAGCGSLVCTNVEEYVARAEQLASTPHHLANDRADLRAKLTHSELTDAAGFVAAIEAAFREMAGSHRPVSL